MKFDWVLVCVLVLAVLAPAAAATEVQYDENTDFSKLRIKELRRLLEERDVQCKGCVEKEHFVQMVKESIHLPLVKKAEKKDRRKPRRPKAQPVNDDMGGDIDPNSLREALKKKLDEQKKMDEALRKAGIKTGAQGFGGK